jgi:malic enzyme
VSLDGRTFSIGQGNNVLVFPGVGLGATAVGARWLPDSAFSTAAHALFESGAVLSAPGDPIFPPIPQLREASRAVGIAVLRV